MRSLGTDGGVVAVAGVHRRLVRDFDKLVFRVPFPVYDPTAASHQELVAVAERAEKVAETVDVSAASTFHQARALIRAELAATGVRDELEAAVEAVLPVVSL